MLSMTVARGATEHRYHDLRPEPSDHAHDVLEDRIARPVAPGLLQRLGVPEVVGAGEELPSAVEPARSQELLTPQQPQGLAQLGTDQILPALATVKREIGRFGTHAADEHRQQLGVLVVGMRADHEDPLVVPEHSQLVLQRNRAAGGRRLELGMERRDGSEGAKQTAERPKHGTAEHGPDRVWTRGN